MVIIMIAGDFLAMSLTTDNVRPSPAAERVADRQADNRRRHHGNRPAGLLRIRLAFGAYRMGFGIDALRTLAFIAIVFGNQATTYTNRERRHLWSSRPSIWLPLLHRRYSDCLDIGRRQASR